MARKRGRAAAANSAQGAVDEFLGTRLSVGKYESLGRTKKAARIAQIKASLKGMASQRAARVFLS